MIEIYLGICITLNLILTTIVLNLVQLDKKQKQMIDKFIEKRREDLDFRNNIVQMFRDKVKELEQNGIQVDVTSIDGIEIKPEVSDDPRIQRYNFYKKLGWSEEKIIEQIDKEFKDYK